jgi:hypothetical protein
MVQLPMVRQYLDRLRGHARQDLRATVLELLSDGAGLLSRRWAALNLGRQVLTNHLGAVVPRDVTNERELALSYAVSLSTERFTGGPQATTELLGTATSIFNWLIGPVALYITIGPIRDQATGEIAQTTVGGNKVQLRDSQKVDLTVSAVDAKGAPVPDDPGTTTDDLLWSIGDESVATLDVSDDTRTCTVIAGMPGSSVVTVALGELSATLAVDVVPGNVALLTINEGTPVDQ